MQQIVARIGLQHVLESLGGLALRREDRVIEHEGRLAPKIRNLENRFAIDRRGEQADDPPFAGKLAVLVEAGARASAGSLS